MVIGPSAAPPAHFPHPRAIYLTSHHPNLTSPRPITHPLLTPPPPRPPPGQALLPQSPEQGRRAGKVCVLRPSQPSSARRRALPAARRASASCSKALPRCGRVRRCRGECKGDDMTAAAEGGGGGGGIRATRRAARRAAARGGPRRHRLRRRARRSSGPISRSGHSTSTPTGSSPLPQLSNGGLEVRVVAARLWLIRARVTTASPCP